MACLAYLARLLNCFHRIYLIDSSLSASTVGSLHKRSFITGFLKVLSRAQYSLLCLHISQGKCNHHKFADDTQLHKPSAPSDFPSLVHDVEQCVDYVGTWMTGNRLELNNDKN